MATDHAHLPSPAHPATASNAADDLIRRLERWFAKRDGVVVCFSGGVDSGLVAAVASRVLGTRAVAFTAVSPSLAPEERETARRLADEIGIAHVLRASDEIHDPRYAANPADRCYFCKRTMFRLARTVAAERGLERVVTGTNADDLGDHVPGIRAEHDDGVAAPLVECGASKADVRAAARQLGLSCWDKPTLACLASRIPSGVPITTERLVQVAQCESAMRALGFRVFRARHHGDVVRLETAPDELARALDPTTRQRLVAACREAGFEHVAIDLAGYRSGSVAAADNSDPTETEVP